MKECFIEFTGSQIMQNVFANVGGTFKILKELRQARVSIDTTISIPNLINMLFDVNGIVLFMFKPSKNRNNFS
jgi:hypothetical protein